MAVDYVARQMAMNALENGGGGGGGDSGTTNYNELENKPKINGFALVGNKSSADLGIIIPDSTSDLTNDSGFITGTAVNALLADYVTETIFDSTIAGFYTKSEVDTKLSGVRSEIALNRRTLGVICKNLMEVTANSQTIKGVTFTVNDNGSITVNGTATERADFNICQSVEYHSGQILTGCPKNGSAETYCLAIYTAGRDTGEGLVLSSDGAHECYIRIEKGYTANNLVFFPMLRDGNIADDTFEPYHPSLQTQVGRLVDSGAKNILNLGDTYFVSTDVTYTFDGDSGAITASKTTGTYKRIVWQLPTETGKKYKVSFDVTAIARSAMIFPTNVSSAGSAPWGQIDVTENGHYSMYFTPAADDVWFVLYLSTSEGTDEIGIENLMVCTAEDYEASPEFAPYVPTNQELYKMILALQNGG